MKDGVREYGSTGLGESHRLMLVRHNRVCASAIVMHDRIGVRRDYLDVRAESIPAAIHLNAFSHTPGVDTDLRDGTRIDTQAALPHIPLDRSVLCVDVVVHGQRVYIGLYCGELNHETTMLTSISTPW